MASRAAAGRSREPSGANGVTMAVSSVPKRVKTSNPPVLTALRLPGGGNPIWHRSTLCLGLGGQRTCRHLGSVGQRRDMEVAEDRGRDVDQLPKTDDGQSSDLHIGMLAGPHRDEMPPGPVVAGDDDAGLGCVGQYSARGL